ncbi:MAG: dTDP-glucose 4,6-dehydratase [Fidelibacterota bacterium]|nr:MAG: dTDP-glucose 4,6-dehydratase [Candidatus Neomarinimicrobiota bacterium]
MKKNESHRRFLVTGGAGFIGGNFVAKVLSEELGEVLVLDKFTYAGHRATLSGWEGHRAFRLVEGDIGDRKLARQLLLDFQPTYLVNFAAESHVDRSIESADDFIATNIVGTYALMDEALSYWSDLTGEARQTFRFHHVSTDEVYGSLGATGAFSERTAYAPNSPYAASKAASDHLVRAYERTHQLPAVVTNCSNNYGPYQFPEKLIPVVLLSALEGKPIPVYGDGLNVRDWLYVEDHCDAILAVLAHGNVGETYNVGGRAEMTNLDLIHTLFDCLRDQADLIREHTEYPTDIDYRSLIEFVADRPGHDRRYAIDSSKIQRELGWTPKENLRTGLGKTVAWYITHLEWCREVLKDNYDRRRLGLEKKAQS